jgi:hypothetical protein
VRSGSVLKRHRACEALSDYQAVAVALDVIDKVRASAPFLTDTDA